MYIHVQVRKEDEAVGELTTYFSVETMIRGYHIYKDVWKSSVGEQLLCEIEENNRQDSHAVAVVRTGPVVGHVPRKLSLISTLFMCQSGQRYALTEDHVTLPAVQKHKRRIPTVKATFTKRSSRAKLQAKMVDIEAQV